MSVIALSPTPLLVLLCLLVTMRPATSNTKCTQTTSDTICELGPKGEQGFAGHRGSPGRRGEKGLKGDSGAPGAAGNKGDKGSAGASGSVGKQGIQGVVGPPGKACTGPPGLQGPPGNTGVQGPPGPAGGKGSKGVKGDTGVKGDVGPRGYSAQDGIPGPPGHPGPTGQTGSKGQHGERGSPGHKGERGPQGPVGAEMSESTIRKFIDPVKEEMKQLKTEVQTMKGQLTTCCNAGPDVVACHLYGSGVSTPLSSGTLVTYWTSSGGVLAGGMTYSNGYITVPVDGLYYVYAQLWSNPLSRQNYCGFYIYQNTNKIGYLYTRNNNPSGEDFSKYGGVVSTLNKGDTLSVKVIGACYYSFSDPAAVFGCFRL